VKLADLIESAEEPLDTILPLDTDAEMMEHFNIFKQYENLD
jgi:hypothetical protein